MLKLIAIEARILWRDRTAWALLLVLAAACVLAVTGGKALMADQIEGRDVAAAAQVESDAEFRERLADTSLPPEDAILSPYRMRATVIAPLPPLVDFSAGRAGFDNYSTPVSMYAQRGGLFKRTRLDNPELLARGTIDLGFVATILAPLALIGLGYGLFAADRDGGRAALILAQGGSPVRLVAARIIPRLALVLAPLGLAAAFLLLTGPDLASRTGAALAWILAAVGLLAFWAALIAFVNSWRITAESAALALVGLWAAVTLILPAALSALVQVAYPPPSRFEQIAAGRAIEVASTREYENDHPELASDGFEGRLASIRKSWSIAKQVDAATREQDLAFDRQLAAQQRFAVGLSWLSPAMIAAQAMERAAGTDAASAAAFRVEANNFLESFRAFGGGFIERGEIMAPGDFARIPAFAMQPQGSGPARSVAVLFALAALFAGLAARRYRKIELA
jgi:ABC-2 type transport system permease protein